MTKRQIMEELIEKLKHEAALTYGGLYHHQLTVSQIIEVLGKKVLK